MKALTLCLIVLTAFPAIASQKEETPQRGEGRRDPITNQLQSRWCKVGETPRKDKCIDGSGSGG